MNLQHATRTPSVPASAKNANTLPAAAVLFAHLSFARVPNPEARTAEAEAFSAGRKGLAVPLLFAGSTVDRIPEGTPAVTERKPRPVAARTEPDERPGRESTPRVAFFQGEARLGYARDEDALWLAPILPEQGGCRAAPFFTWAVYCVEGGGAVGVIAEGVPFRLVSLGYVEEG